MFQWWSIQTRQYTVNWVWRAPLRKGEICNERKGSAIPHASAPEPWSGGRWGNTARPQTADRSSTTSTMQFKGRIWSSMAASRGQKLTGIFQQTEYIVPRCVWPLSNPTKNGNCNPTPLKERVGWGQKSDPHRTRQQTSIRQNTILMYRLAKARHLTCGLPEGNPL